MSCQSALSPEAAKARISPTVNESFNRGVSVLLGYHRVFDLGGHPALDMSHRPIGIRSDRTWQIYADAMMAVYIIGRRNGWVTLHHDRNGRLVYWLFDIPYHHPKDRNR